MSREDAAGYDASAHIAWCDPPWLITGRTVTAWFPVPQGVLEASLPRSLRRDGEEPWARLRFYDARFEVCDPPPDAPLAPRAGAFREAVVAFPAAAGGCEGDATMFMWADDEPYTAWGREVYGWPILRGALTLEGSIWDAQLAPGATGSCQLWAASGSAALEGVEIAGPVDSTTSGGWWLNPRRRLERAGLEGERNDIVAARPRILNPGLAYAASGSLRLAFAPGHPLHGLTPTAERVVLVDGFELIVGEEVTVVDASPASS
jgi:hypothetical protein